MVYYKYIYLYKSKLSAGVAAKLETMYNCDLLRVNEPLLK